MCGVVRFSLGVAQGYVDYGRWPIVVCGAVRFSLGVGQGYVDYGRWPIVCVVRCVFPWALPRAMLTMAVGQLCVWCGAFFPGRCPGLC